MPLQKQLATLPLRAGLDTKTAAQAVVAGRFVELQNVTFTRTGAFQKRNGFAQLGRRVAAATGSAPLLEDGQALMGFRGELLAADPTTLYSYNGSAEQWVDKGTLVSCAVTQRPVSAPAYEQTEQDGATHSSGLQAYAWVENGACRYSVIDGNTGQIVVPSTSFGIGVSRPRVLVMGNLFVFIVYDSSTRLYLGTLSIAEPLTAITMTAITSALVDANSLDPVTPAYDAAVIETQAVGRCLYLAFNSDLAGGGLSIWRFAPTSLTVPVAKVSVPGEVATTLTVFPNGYDDSVFVAYYTGAGVMFRAYAAALCEPELTFITPVTIDASNDQFIAYLYVTGRTSDALTATIAHATYSTPAALFAAIEAAALAAAYDGTTFALAGGSIDFAVTLAGIVNVTIGTLDDADNVLSFQTNAASQALGTLLGFGTAEVALAWANGEGTATGASAMPAGITIGSGSPVLLTHGLVESIAGTQSITGVACSDTSLDVRFFYDSGSGVRTAAITGTEYRISAYWFMLGAPWCEITVAPTTLRRGVYLAGKAFTRSGQAYVLVSHESDLQSTFFLLDGDGVILARLYPGTAAIGVTMLPQASPVDESTWRYALREARGVVVKGLPGLGAVTSGSFDLFEPALSYGRAEIGQNLNVTGGILWAYDGAAPVEQGFLLAPEDLSASGANEDPAGPYLYQYVAVYSWTDAQGNVHRSAPSVPLAYGQTTAISTGADLVLVTVPTLRLTNRDAASVRIEIYRTESNGENFYRLTLPSEKANTDTADAVEYTDTTTDAALVDGVPLYTTGDVLDNATPPATTDLCVHGKRLFALAIDGSIWPSKETLTGEPVEFAAELAFSTDGEPVAIASMDDKLIVFDRDAIAYVTGDGPDDKGEGGSFSRPVVLPGAVGCVNPRSVVATPMGLMFQSEKGFRLLGRDLSVSYIGADVQRYNDRTVTSAVLIEDADQVRFQLAPTTDGGNDGIALVFDYFDAMQGAGPGQWCIFTNVSSVDSIIWDGNHTYLRPSGAVLEETPGVFTDAGSHIPIRLVTSWLQFASFSGFQRVYHCIILGAYASPHRLQVSAAYDFEPAPVQSEIVEPTAPGTWGSDATWGSGATWGGDFEPYAWRINLNRGAGRTAKCTALQLTIEDVADGAPGESMSLTAVTFLVGTKRGTRTLPGANVAG